MNPREALKFAKKHKVQVVGSRFVDLAALLNSCERAYGNPHLNASPERAGTPHAITHVQQQRAQPPFGWNRWPPCRCVQRAEVTVQIAQHLAHQRAYCREWVPCRYPLLR
jgi:hypothetical protein